MQLKRTVYQYSSTTFNATTKGKVIPKNTLLNVSAIVKTSAGTPRLKLANGTYITANRSNVVKVSSKIGNYYTKTPKKILVKSGINVYNNANFDKKISSVKKNTVLSIKDVVYSSGGTPRLKTISGSYITANKYFVLVVGSSISNYIYVNPGKVLLKKSVYQYNSTSFTSSTRGKAISKGKTLTVKSIAFTSGGTPRLKLSNGKYITANKSFVLAR